MDRSLWLLNFLRGRGWVRRWSRSVGTLKGLLLAVVGSLVFMPVMVSVLLAPRVQTAAQVDAIRKYGPLGLLAYCVMNVLLSAGDRSVYYSPAEVNFLFCGPYRPRQLLIYKVAGGTAAALLTSLLMTFALAHHAARFLSAYVGIFLALVLLYLFSLAVGLAASTAGAMAFSRGRKLVLLSVLLIGAGAVWPLGREAFNLSPADLVERALRSPTVAAVLVPFRPFVMTTTAERVWPDLLYWSAASALVDLTLLGLVLGLNARFLEASAAASARIFDRIQRSRQGRVWSNAGTTRVVVPMLPWWGGVGPNFWRQLTTASRSPSRVVALTILLLLPAGFVLVAARGVPDVRVLVGPALIVFLGIAVVAPSVVGYDFRPDLRQMQDLKTLPIRPARLVLGQLLTPLLILSAGEWLTVALIAGLTNPDLALTAPIAALVLPVNLVLLAIENLYFLWFPYRNVGINSFDFQAMGRQTLLLLAKVVTVVVVGALASGGGAIVYLLAGKNLTPALVASWVVVSACGIGAIPLVGQAFERFDVAGDRPE